MSDLSQEEKNVVARANEGEGPQGLTIRAAILSVFFSVVFSVATIFTLVVLSFSMGVVGVVSVILASSASIWGANVATKNRVRPPTAQEFVGSSWLSSAFIQSLGTTIVIGGVFLMQYILPSSSFPLWQRWWFAPAQSDLGNLVSWLPTILFWMLITLLVRMAVIGVGLKFKRRYVETDELPFPTAEGQADLIKELTPPNQPPTTSLRYFLVGLVFALMFSLVVEHNWDYPLLTPLVASATGVVLFVGALNNAFPWRIGEKMPRGVDKVAYYFAYFFFLIGILGLVSCVYAPAGSIFYYLRFGLPHVTDPSYVIRFIDLSFMIPQLGGLGFGVSISILFFIIGYLLPADASSGALIGSLSAFVLVPLGFIALTGSVNQTLLLNIDLSLSLAALLCATIVGSAVVITRTLLTNREGSKRVILGGMKALYTVGEGRRARSRAKGYKRLGGNVWIQALLVWVPPIILALVAMLILGTEPSMPWYLTLIILFFALAVAPLVTTLGTWVASRTTRMTSQSPLPFFYEAVLFGTGVRELSPYAFGAPVALQAPGLLSQLRVARLTKTESKVVYLADILGFPLLSVFLSFLICIWVFSAIGTPEAGLTPPGTGGTTAFGQWNFAPVWNALYTFILWLAQGGGAFPYQCDPIVFFLLPLLVLSTWTILHGFRRIPIASISGLLIGFAVLPYIAITIALGSLTATIVKKRKGVEWFAKYGMNLGAGVYAGASISMFLILVVAPLIP